MDSWHGVRFRGLARLNRAKGVDLGRVVSLGGLDRWNGPKGVNSWHGVAFRGRGRPQRRKAVGRGWVVNRRRIRIGLGGRRKPLGLDLAQEGRDVPSGGPAHGRRGRAAMRLVVWISVNRASVSTQGQALLCIGRMARATGNKVCVGLTRRGCEGGPGGRQQRDQRCKLGRARVRGRRQIIDRGHRDRGPVRRRLLRSHQAGRSRSGLPLRLAE